MAAAAAAHGSMVQGRRRPCWIGTPEIYFAKTIDNSRLVKVEDPTRNREMGQFCTALAVLFVVVMTFAWQHYKAIEYGYQIEALKSKRNGLAELNHALQLEEAKLRDPQRVDNWARMHGLVPPQAGQVIRMDAGSPDAGAPIMASASPISVVSVP